MRYYLAYGSNLNVLQMHRRCPEAKLFGTANLENFHLLFRGSKTGAYLTVEPYKGGSVPLAVWRVSKGDEQKLDWYEGYPIFYQKIDTSIMCVPIESGRSLTVHAFLYLMNPSNPPGVPSDQYWDTCSAGYRYFGFDRGTLCQALQDTVKIMTGRVS